jgi:hypothetical protein
VTDGGKNYDGRQAGLKIDRYEEIAGQPRPVQGPERRRSPQDDRLPEVSVTKEPA